MQTTAVAKWIRRGALVALTTTTMIMVGCGGGGGGGNSAATPGASGSSGSGSGAVAGAPTISGSPMTKIDVGAAYALAPQAKDPDGDTLAFSIQNRPTWAAFNTVTGQLTGTPTAQNVGTTSNVVISVSDGKSSANLPAFSITVVAAGTSADPTPVPVVGKAVALSWEVPTQTLDGATLGDLTGYRIHYGTKADQLVQSIEVPSAGMNAYTVDKLTSGTYYFAVRAVTANGSESQLSNVISRVIS